MRHRSRASPTRASLKVTEHPQLKGHEAAGWCGSVDWALAGEPSLVPFPVREHAWVVGQVPSRGRVRGNLVSHAHSLPPFHFLSLSKKKNVPEPSQQQKVSQSPLPTLSQHRGPARQVRCLSHRAGSIKVLICDIGNGHITWNWTFLI